MFGVVCDADVTVILVIVVTRVIVEEVVRMLLSLLNFREYQNEFAQLRGLPRAAGVRVPISSISWPPRMPDAPHC